MPVLAFGNAANHHLADIPDLGYSGNLVARLGQKGKKLLE